MIYLRIREIAESQGYTVGDLAQKAHVRTSYLLALWQNPYHDLNLRLLDRIATALHVPAQELIQSINTPSE